MHCGIQGRGISTLSMVDESVKAEREETKSDVHKKKGQYQKDTNW